MMRPEEMARAVEQAHAALEPRPLHMRQVTANEELFARALLELANVDPPRQCSQDEPHVAHRWYEHERDECWQCPGRSATFEIRREADAVTWSLLANGNFVTAATDDVTIRSRLADLLLNLDQPVTATIRLVDDNSLTARRDRLDEHHG